MDKILRYYISKETPDSPWRPLEGEGVFDIPLEYACNHFLEWLKDWESSHERIPGRSRLRRIKSIYKKLKSIQQHLEIAKTRSAKIFKYADSNPVSVGDAFIFPSLRDEQLLSIHCLICNRNYDPMEIHVEERIVDDFGSQRCEDAIICPNNHILYAEAKWVET